MFGPKRSLAFNIVCHKMVRESGTWEIYLEPFPKFEDALPSALVILLLEKFKICTKKTGT